MSNRREIKDIPYDLAISTFDYNPVTGLFMWKSRDITGFHNEQSFKAWHTKFAHKPAFTNINPKGYNQAKIWGNRYLAHRVAWVMHYGKQPKFWLDHINGNRSDNRIENLREVNATENGLNRPENKNNRTGLKGVTLDSVTNRYSARIRLGDNKYYLGMFATAELAHAAYVEKMNEIHGDFGRASRD